MPRQRRNWRPGAYFHVVMRGNNRANIYNDSQDKYHLMRCIEDAHTRYPFTIVAFCIMSNHFHILMKSEEDLSKIMKLINRRYSDYYSKRYRHVGRIYQRRYYSKLVSNPAALLIVSRYIHRNPIETRIPMVDDLKDYPYSSFPLYSNPYSEPQSYIDISLLPLCLPVTFGKTTAGYSSYCLWKFGKEENEEMSEWMMEMQ
ncbi:transposase [Sporosarcina sp. BI001-red]|nr:transposase [Sporosarcina sp. BI001-red]